MATAAERIVAQRIRESIGVKQGLLAMADRIAAVARCMLEAYRTGGKVIVFGNGGSAADAQHIAAELIGRFRLERPPVPALALTTNTSSLTAIANDYGFGEVFARQVRAWGSVGDVCIGISTSGESENVLRGLAAARAIGMVTVGLTGARGGRMKDIVDHWIGVPSESTARIQEGHILIGHVLCEIVEASLFESADPAAGGPERPLVERR